MYDNEVTYDGYSDFNKNKIMKKTKKFKFNKFFFLIIGIFLVLIVVLYIHNNIKYHNSYEYLEDKLEKAAKEYVKNNNLKNSNEVYIEVDKLNVELKDNCYSVSGVFVKDNNYQPYLICSDYETKFNNENEYIKLNGRDIVFINKDIEYVETYYETLSDVSVDIKTNIGTTEGVYYVDYVITKNNLVLKTITRKIIFLDNDEITNFYPKVTLNGEKTEFLEINSNYIEKGVNSFDIDDGIISDVKIIGEVDNKHAGEYNLNYIVMNSKGYASSVKRKVIVVNSEIVVDYITFPTDFTNGNVSIILQVYCENYKYTLLPNNEISYEKNIQYEVGENGSYSFKIYAKNETFKEEIITVENIDLEKPNGSCSGYYLDNKSYITVNAEDSGSGIDKYVIDGSAYNDKAIILPGEIKNISVNIYDKSGNYINVSCQLEDRNPVTSACNDKTIYPGNKYVFTQEQKEKMAAMVSAEAGGNPNEATDFLGMKLVASHMCNYYEKLYKNEEWTGKKLHWLITTSNWYAEMTKKSKYNSTNPRHQLALQAVEEVMVNGNRILPHYIDEFDMFPNDVMRPLSNVEEYERDKTIYYGINWIKVTFWCINMDPGGKRGNIFGYTSK